MSAIGASLIGKRYHLVEKIGQGGMGIVYKAIDTHTNETVAIKQLQAEIVAADPEMIERFIREGEALRQLNHPNIVKMLAALEENNNSYLVIEFVSGGDLNTLLRQNGKLPIKRTLEIALDLTDALTRAHRLQIIHRDLKPANVLLASDGTPRLTDFGVAHIGSKERVTGTGVAVGTLDYLSPESLTSNAVDTRTDIWSFGVMLFEMLAGHRPFTGETVTNLLIAIVGEPVPDLEALRPDAPAALVDLVYRMLEKDPQSRIPSIRQVGLELETLLQGRDTSKSFVKPLDDPKRFATPTPSVQTHKNNLPAQTTPFVGREVELAELAQLISTPSIRLVSILASGGMGKTRLSLEVAAQQLGNFHSGVYFVELAPLSAVENIPTAIAEATGYQFQSDGREPKEQIIDFLHSKAVLLVMDNFEHLIDGAGIVSDILRAAPNVKILVTSRQRLNQSGETLFNLEGMAFPDWETLEEALESSAVKLFMQSARRARPAFELQADDLQAVAHICRMVEGLPLGILLAASWLEMLSPQEIVDEMARSLDFLETQMTDIPERQRSIRAVFDYSWNLMTPDEQVVFMRLAVFRNGFTREAAQAVAGANLRVLMNLLNKSLIRRDADSGRYSTHELLRQYAAEQLQRTGGVEKAYAAHSDYYSREVEKSRATLMSAQQRTAIKNIDADIENIHHALLWAAEHGAWDNIDRTLDTIGIYDEMVSRFQESSIRLQKLDEKCIQGGLKEDNLLFWRVRALHGRTLARFGHYQQGLAMCEQCLPAFERANKPRDIALIYAMMGYGLMFQGKYEDAKTYAQKAIDTIPASSDNFDVINPALGILGYAHFLIGEYDEAKRLFQQNLADVEKIGSPPGIAAIIYNNLGEVHHALDEDSQAQPLFEKALELFKDIGNKYGMAFCLNNLGNIAHTAANFALAQQYNQQALDLYRSIGDRRGTADALNRMGGTAFSIREYALAETYHTEALEIYTEMGDKRGVANSLVLLANTPNALGDYDQALAYVQESLELRLEMGNPLEIVDSLWFMALNNGLKEDVDFADAIHYLDEADRILQEASFFDPRQNMFRILINLYHKRYDECQRLSDLILPFLDQIERLPWVLLQVHITRASIFIGLKQYKEAKPFLLKAILLGRRINSLDWVVCAAIHAAYILTKENHPDAAAWIAFGSEHQLYYAFMRKIAREYLAELATTLSPKAYADAIARGKTLDEATVIDGVMSALQASKD